MVSRTARRSRASAMCPCSLPPRTTSPQRVRRAGMDVRYPRGGVRRERRSPEHLYQRRQDHRLLHLCGPVDVELAGPVRALGVVATQRGGDLPRGLPLLSGLCHRQHQRHHSAAAPAWVIEGGADWAAASILPFDEPAWRTYLETPGTSLATRSYDAVGLFLRSSTSAGHSGRSGGASGRRRRKADGGPPTGTTPSSVITAPRSPTPRVS